MSFRTPARSRSALLAVTAAALLVLTGCAAPSGADEAGGAGAAAGALLPPAEGTTEYPLTIDTWAGETVIPERPERVAAIGFSTNLDVLQAIDAVPVYTLTEDAPYAWRDADFFEAIETVDESTRRDPINFEALAASEPELIVILNYVTDEAEFAKLSAIAPVLEFDEQVGDKADWRAGQRLVGEALDLQAAAEAAIEQSDAAVAAVAEAHPEFAGQTITIATDYGTSFDYYTPTGGTAESVMLDLGFAPNPLAADWVDDAIISDENLSALDGDILLVIYADEATKEARESQALFQALPPVQEGRYVALHVPADDEFALQTDEGEIVENPTWVLRRGASAVSLPWATEVIADEWLAGVSS